MTRGRNVPCHCFGSSETEVIDWTSTLRTVALTAGAVGLFVLSMQGYSPPSGGDMAPAVAIAAGLLLLTRLVGFVPTAWSYLREPRSRCAGSARRVSLRSEPLETSIKALFGAPAHSHEGNNGHMTDGAAVLHQIGDRELARCGSSRSLPNGSSSWRWDSCWPAHCARSDFPACDSKIPAL